MSNNTSIYTIDNNNYNSISSITTTLSSTNSAIIYNGSYYLVGGNAVVYSTNASNWSSPATITGMSSINNFAWNTPYLGTPYIKPLTIACGEGNHTLAYSDDGIYWKGIGKNIFSTRANKAVWNGIMWVAVGTGNYWVASSYDGIFWSGRDNSIMTEAYDIAWNGTVFVAVGCGVSNNIAISRDGIVWYVSPYSSVFSIRASAISWTGSMWVAIGSGGNTTACSNSIDAWVWNQTTPPNMIITDASSVIITNGLTTNEIIASSLGGTTTAFNAIDNSMNPTSSTEWNSSIGTYNALTGINTGLTTTSYNGTLSVSGEWIQIDAKTPILPIYYHLSWFLDTSSNNYTIPKEWYILGSVDGDNWGLVDYYNYGTTTAPVNSSSPYLIKMKNIYSNQQRYQYYRIVIPSIFSGGSLTYTRISEFDFFIENPNSKIVSPYLKPIITRTHILYPTSIIQLSTTQGKQTIYNITDLKGGAVSNNTINNGSILTNIINGANNNIITGTAFDGQNLIATTLQGNICYINNNSLNTNQSFDISINGVIINKKITGNTYSCCFNGKYIILGGGGEGNGNGSNVITYGPPLQTNPDASFNNSINANTLFTKVWGVASNSGYGPTYIGNRIYFNPGDKISLVAPKAYNKNLTNNNTFSFNLNNTNIIQNIVLPSATTIINYFGPAGVTGPYGLQGANGVLGPTGSAGSYGPTGICGLRGDTGRCGLTGNTGYNNVVGCIGNTGINGYIGLTGPSGIIGLTGCKGYSYPILPGFTGSVGSTGSRGPIDTQRWVTNDINKNIYTTGVVGINNPTPNPTYILDVSGGVDIKGDITISGGVEISNNINTQKLIIGKRIGSKTVDVSGSMIISNRLLINKGTITPGFLLDISGAFYAKGVNTNSIRKNRIEPTLIDSMSITMDYSIGDCIYMNMGSTIVSNFSTIIQNPPIVDNRDNKITLIIDYSNSGIDRYYCDKLVIGGVTVYPLFNGGNPSVIYTTTGCIIQEFSIIRVGNSYRIFCDFTDYTN